MDVIGVGDSSLDLLLKIGRMPSAGQKARSEEMGRTPGGMVGNFCCGVARHGLRCGIVTSVGDDEFGRVILQDYQERGLAMDGVQVIKDGRTFYCVCLIDEHGEKILFTVASDLISPRKDLIDSAYLRSARYVHMNSMDIALTRDVAARLVGSQTRLTLDYEAHADQAGFANWKPVLENVSILFINEDGMASLMNLPADEAAPRLLELGIEAVVLTCAEKGGCVYTREETCPYAAFPVKKVVDTTGAGDCFNAAFLASRIRGDSVAQSARYAAAAASISIGHWGARAGLPSRAEVENLLKTAQA